MWQSILSYLPQHEGLLPKWLFFISLVSVLNSVQAYTTLSFTSRVYAGPAPPKPILSSPSTTTPPPSTNPYASQLHPSAPLSPATPLASRLFGTWTVIQSLVRVYAAYNISNSAFYQLAFLTYAVAWCHFMSEWWVFGTARMGQGLFFPILVANGSLVWMWMVWGEYVV